MVPELWYVKDGELFCESGPTRNTDIWVQESIMMIMS